MSTILTMEIDGVYRTFRLDANGNGKDENGKLIPDFAALFEQLIMSGWRTVAETNLPESEIARETRYLRKRETFRDQWNEYLAENSDNLELEFAM